MFFVEWVHTAFLEIEENGWLSHIFGALDMCMISQIEPCLPLVCGIRGVWTVM